MLRSEEELKHAIALGESSTLQFKREWSDNNSIAREIVAFANGKGGTIVFGVEDKTVRRKSEKFGEKFIENNEKFGEKTEKFGEKTEKFGENNGKFGENNGKFIEGSKKKFIESSMTTADKIKELIEKDNGGRWEINRYR